MPVDGTRRWTRLLFQNNRLVRLAAAAWTAPSATAGLTSPLLSSPASTAVMASATVAGTRSPASHPRPVANTP